MSTVCQFFGTTKGCKYGDLCTFIHSKGENKIVPLKKTNSSSIVSMPPSEFWEQFVEIKKHHMNPNIKRPPFPHVTLIQPFLSYSEFDKAAKQLKEKLSTFKSFYVEISTFEIFKNKSSSTLYLDPITDPKDAYQELFSIVKSVFGDCLNDNFKFSPHIGIGYFTNHKEAKELQTKYQKDWKKIKFQVREIYFMTHVTKDSPFEVRKVIPFGDHSEKPYFEEKPEK
jgi:poly(A) polymerase